MTYKDLLNFKNQKIVDEVYKRYKKDQPSDELDKAYQEIKNANQSKLQTAHYQYEQIINKFLQLINLISMILYAILFIVLGSMVLSCGLAYLNFLLIKPLGSVYNTFCDIGAFFYENMFHLSINDLLHGITDYSSNVSNTMILYVIGMTIILIFIFSLILIYSFFQKNNDINKEIQVTLKESYRYLQCNEDDNWEYIQSCLEKKLKKRKNKGFFEKYYLSYLCIFEHYKECSGTIKELDKKDKAKLYFFTFTNTIKNIFGSLSKPIYFSIAIMIVYYRNFNYTSLLTLEIFLDAIPLGNILYWFIDFSCVIFGNMPFLKILKHFKLELSKMICFCIFLTLVWFIVDILKNKIPESKRQYHRRLNFYLKKKNNIYLSNKKYPKEYNYGVQFFVFILFVCGFIGLHYLDLKLSPLNLMDKNQRTETEKSMEKSGQIFARIDKYAMKKKDVFYRQDRIFQTNYVYVDEMRKNTNFMPIYLKVYTFYNDKDAMNAVKKSILLKNNKLKTNKKTKVQYYYSDNGFIIKDGSIVIVMKNNDKIIDELFTDDMITYNNSIPKNKSLSQNEMRKLMKNIGYSF